MYKFQFFNTGLITPKESFMYAYAEEINKSEQVRTSTKKLNQILYSKYKKAYLNKFMKNQCQYLI